MKKLLSLFLTFTMLLSLCLPSLAEAGTEASAEKDVDKLVDSLGTSLEEAIGITHHEITSKTFPLYKGNEKVEKDLKLYFLNAANDLPYMEVNDLLPLLNLVYEGDLFTMSAEDAVVTFNRHSALAGGESFNLIATSMGAPVASAYCAKHPSVVKRLIYYAPAGMDTFKPPFYMYLSACPLIGDFIFANWGDKVLFKNVTREMKHVDVDPYREKLAESFRYKGFSRCTLSSLRHTILKTKKSTGFFIEAAKLNIPTLCLWGRDDITMPFYMSGRFREIMPGAEFHKLDGSGHIFVYDEVEKAAQWTLPFLKNNTEA